MELARRCCGSAPVRSLLHMSSLVRLPPWEGARLFNWVGMLPLSRFSETSNQVRLLRLPISLGMLPAKMLPSSSSTLRLDKLPSHEGRLPESRLRSTSSLLRLLRLRHCEGIRPVRLLLSSRKSVRAVRLPKSARSVPLSPVLERCSAVTRSLLMITPLHLVIFCLFEEPQSLVTPP